MAIGYRRDTAQGLEGEIQQASGSRYISDILLKMQEDGIVIDAAVYRRVRDKMMSAAAAEQEQADSLYNEASKQQLKSYGSGLLAGADPMRILGSMQQGFEAQRAKMTPRPPSLLDDIAPGEIGDQARRLKKIRDGEIKVEESPVALQVADTLVRQASQVGLPYIGGRLTLGVERDHTNDTRGQQVAEGAAGLLGMGANVAATAALFKGAGLGAAAAPAAMGANMAFQEGRKGLLDRSMAFAEGASIGTVATGYGTLRNAALRKMVGETGSARMALEKTLRSAPAQYMSAGELGAGFSVAESLRRGELPDPVDMAMGYATFALSHSVQHGLGELTPKARLERATSRRMEEFVDGPEGAYIRDLHKAGIPAPYFEAYGQKMGEFRAELKKKHDPKAADKDTDKLAEDYVAVVGQAAEEMVPGEANWSASIAPKVIARAIADPVASAAVRARNAEIIAESSRKAQEQADAAARQRQDNATAAEADRAAAIERSKDRVATVASTKRAEIERRAAEMARRRESVQADNERIRQERAAAASVVVRDVTPKTVEPHDAPVLLGDGAKVYYRGSNTGDNRRIKTGVESWDKRLFVTETIDGAKLYGDNIEQVALNKDAQILKEGTREFSRVGSHRKGETMLDWANRVITGAEDLGYDAVHFKRQTDIGTVVLNEKSIIYRGRPIEPQDAPVLLDVPTVPRGTIKPIMQQDVVEMADAAARQEAIASGALTAEQARAQRMAESAARREQADIAAQASREAEQLAMGRKPPMTADRIIEIAKAEGGMARLKEMGYDTIDLLRSVKEVKDRERGMGDPTVGFGLGGGDFRGAAELAVKGASKLFLGMSSITNNSMKPFDRVSDRINRVYWENVGRPSENVTRKVGKILSEEFFPTKKAYGYFLAAAAHVAPLRYGILSLPKYGGIKEQLNKMTDFQNAIALQAANKEADVRPILNDAVRDVMKKYGIQEPEAHYILMKFYEFGAEGRRGGKPGANLIRDMVADPYAGKRLTDRMKKSLGIAIDMIEGGAPESASVLVDGIAKMNEQCFTDMLNSGMVGQRFVEAVYETEAAATRAWQKMVDERPEYDWKVYPTENGLALTGVTGSLQDGMRYLPGYANVDITGKRKVASRGGIKGGTESAATKERKTRGGSLERELFQGKAPKTYDLAQTVRLIHMRTYSPIMARQTAQRLTGMEIDGMPAAIRKTVKDKMVREAGRDMFQEYEDYSSVPGFQFHTASGLKDALLLHPEMQRAVGNLTGPVAIQDPYVAWAFRLNGKMKSAKLTLSPFHFWALSMNALAYGVDPMKAWKDHKTIVRSPEALRIVKAGLTTDAADIYLSGVGFESVWGSPSFGGKVKRAGARTERYFQKKLWDELYRATKITSALSAERSFLEMGLSPKDATNQAVISVNALHGGLNYQRWGMSVRAKQIASMFMLAPDWTISNFAWSANIAAGQNSRAIYERKALARYAVTAYVMGNMMNYMLSGHFMWDNDDDHKHQVEMDIGGEKRWLDPWGHFAESFEVMVGFVNKAIPEEKQIPLGRDPYRYLPSKAAPVPTAGYRIMSGQTRYPMGYASPGIMDLIDGKTHGAWGKRNYNPDAFLGIWVDAFTPISGVNAFNPAVEGRGFTDARTLSGIIGRQVYQEDNK